MFNGIVETIGTIKAILAKNGCKQFTIVPQKPLTDLNINDSLAVNGVCLTVTGFSGGGVEATAVPETLKLTNLDYLKVNDAVNLERPLKMTDRIGGHYVQGHVDGLGKIMSIQPEGDALLVKMSIPPALARYIVRKGYIALDGMSITVIDAEPDWISVTFIPHTQQITIINQYHEGGLINIEVDILAKYVEKLFNTR